jgi:adenylate cyclase
VLEGSVRRSGNQLRITAQLIDATTGNHLWADRYDRELKDLFTIQDNVTLGVLTSLQVKLTKGEEARMWARGTSNLDAYLKVLEAAENVLRTNKESNVLARQLAKEAIDLDPQYPFAYTILAATHMLDVWLGITLSPKQSIAQAIELAQKAISIDESFGKARGLLGFLYTMTGQHEKGVAEAEKAVTLDPNSDTALNYLGLALRFGGRPNEAIPVIKKAIRLNPFAPSAYLYNLGLCYVLTGQFEEAIAECKKATICEPDNLLAQVALTTVYALSGRDEEARATASEILRIDPKFSLENYSKTLPYKNQADRHRVIDALRKAGLK